MAVRTLKRAALLAAAGAALAAAQPAMAQVRVASGISVCLNGVVKIVQHANAVILLLECGRCRARVGHEDGCRRPVRRRCRRLVRRPRLRDQEARAPRPVHPEPISVDALLEAVGNGQRILTRTGRVFQNFEYDR